MKKFFLNPVRNHFSRRINELEYQINHPFEAQEQVLNSLIFKAKKTEWGILYSYSNIRNTQEYSERIPVHDYEALKPYIDRILRGEENILWPGVIKWFAKSSGTTSDKSKFIPVSHEALIDCHYKAGKDLLAVIYNNNPESKIHKGYGVTLGGNSKINKLHRYSRIGDLSAILMQNLPAWARLWQQPGMKTSLLEDWELKINRIANETKNKNITHITGVPTWTIILIQKLLEMTGKKNLSEIWPQIEMYIHGGVSFDPYREIFRKLIPSPQMTYIENYNASEGYFGIQDDPKKNDMLLLLNHGVYYEFMPSEEFDKEHPRCISLAEVEEGINYALVISTNAGLWRYLIGDTIRFTSINPFRFKLTGRTKNFINAFGEELIVENAEQAITQTCLQTGAEVTDYTAAPVFFNETNNGSHEWLIEFKTPPDDLERFRKLLDENLKNLNSDYEAKRFKNIALSLPTINIVPQGIFYNWLKKKGKLGGQHKIPRLFNNRYYVEDVKAFMEKQKPKEKK